MLWISRFFHFLLLNQGSTRDRWVGRLARQPQLKCLRLMLSPQPVCLHCQRTHAKLKDGMAIQFEASTCDGIPKGCASICLFDGRGRPSHLMFDLLHVPFLTTPSKINSETGGSGVIVGQASLWVGRQCGSGVSPDNFGLLKKNQEA